LDGEGFGYVFGAEDDGVDSGGELGGGGVGFVMTDIHCGSDGEREEFLDGILGIWLLYFLISRVAMIRSFYRN
jgi:hypothetical protein|tara:strand:+ start:6018 stop:6236 length:219 start_codon:yes stop_codon:yes gene_type:complete